jgi:hypothetical protein
VYSECLIRATTRLSRRSAAELRLIRRATARIEELSAVIDRQMQDERRPAEQLTLLRLATSQITRSANDAIQAYRRVAEGLRDEGQRSDSDPDETARAATDLAEARDGMLKALDVASRRYPWAKPWPVRDGERRIEGQGERPGG